MKKSSVMHWISRIAACLLCGFVLDMFVVGGLVLFGPTAGQRPFAELAQQMVASQAGAFGVIHTSRGASRVAFARTIPGTQGAFIQTNVDPPFWIEFPRTAGLVETETQAYGFPCLSWKGWEERTVARPATVISSTFLVQIGREKRGVPSRPLPGIPVNAAFYGAICVCLDLGLRPFFARWRARREVVRGRCPACRYDLRGLTTPTCPECGSPIDPATE